VGACLAVHLADAGYEALVALEGATALTAWLLPTGK
jgi:hypothetical protein